MHTLPQLSTQQKSESDSFAILLYKIRELGIFRNLTANDFGIDFEIELVSEGNVSGRLIKAQLKSKQTFKKDSKDQVSVSGIAQSTLSYWLSVSKHCPVIVFGVDLATEEIFHSGAIYFQAAALIDGTAASKTVKLPYRISTDGRGLDHLRAIALDYGFEAKRLMHEDALLQIECIRDSYNWWTNNRRTNCLEIVDPERFPWLLRTARALLGYAPLIKHCQQHKLDLNRFYDINYWVERSDEICGYTEGLLKYEATRKHIPFLARLLLEHLKQRRESMLGPEAFYWLHEDPKYLNMVFEFGFSGKTKTLGWSPTYYRTDFIEFQQKEADKLKKRIEDYEKAKAKRKGQASAYGIEE